ncbi:hypothetical protein [Shewanella aestuarii]|uniref:Uncharacterized protein n=1 Tax=Shewanella aestuarii TaxID=1028752 RepID=A0A6G9QJ59_9GAMM|nr:hypothetical protein [Shewanella aestuarii]QIR14107.1 hypothetical protein HBH39_06065 [Shewanella aestuarii]
MLTKGKWLFLATTVFMSHIAMAEDAAQKAFTDEVIQCAAYYQISADAIAGMNAPQMQSVSERLKISAVDAITLAEKYRSSEQVQQDLATEKQKQIDSLGGSSSLGVLIKKYKELCKTVVYNPQKRLDYWSMATM